MATIDDNDEFFDPSDSTEWLLGKKIYEDDERIESISKASLVCVNIENFTYNRRLNDKHKENLKDKIKLLGKVLGNISLAIDPKGYLRILDGQHRVKAILSLLQEDEFRDYDIHLTTYKVPKLESRATLSLFQSLNNTLNLEENPLLEDVHEIVEFLSTLYPDAIIDTDRRKNRPKVDKRRLKERLEINLLIHFHTKLDIQKFNNLIVNKNREYSVKPLKQLCGNTNITSRKRLETSKEIGWYLTIKDCEKLPNNAHIDDTGRKFFCDKWLLEVIDEYKS